MADDVVSFNAEGAPRASSVVRSRSALLLYSPLYASTMRPTVPMEALDTFLQSYDDAFGNTSLHLSQINRSGWREWQFCISQFCISYCRLSSISTSIKYYAPTPNLCGSYVLALRKFILTDSSVLLLILSVITLETLFHL